MPTYEYVCKSCGHIFEIVQSMKDDSLAECPECGGELRKVFAPPAISFKGSGFYATDHRNKSKRSTERAAEKSDAARSEKGPEADKGPEKGTKPDRGPGDPGGAAKPEGSKTAESSSESGSADSSARPSGAPTRRPQEGPKEGDSS